ncbi:MAG TPA: helix-turn-helix transcriptional regulator [Thermoanaerobaculia bacterium]|jgi:transcriptional regulator with XRE-family HTH domain
MPKNAFANLGKTLALVRELRGLSQAEVARRAKMGKSQISKYENGKELPKLDSLSSVLDALQIGVFEFWYTFHLVNMAAENIGLEAAMKAQKLPPLPLSGPGLLSNETDAAFRHLVEVVMHVYHRMYFEKLGS